jgi:hypothetical protein
VREPGDLMKFAFRDWYGNAGADSARIVISVRTTGDDPATCIAISPIDRPPIAVYGYRELGFPLLRARKSAR